MTAHPVHGRRSGEALRLACDRGTVAACSVVRAGVAGWYEDDEQMRTDMGTMGIAFSAISESAAALAGTVWRACPSSGGRRERLAPDFPIGAHARLQADAPLTRDRGFGWHDFRPLTIVDPTLDRS